MMVEPWRRVSPKDKWFNHLEYRLGIHMVRVQEQNETHFLLWILSKPREKTRGSSPMHPKARSKKPSVSILKCRINPSVRRKHQLQGLWRNQWTIEHRITPFLEIL